VTKRCGPISPGNVKALPGLSLPAQKYFFAADQTILRNLRLDRRILVDDEARSFEPASEITTEEADVIMLVEIQDTIFFCFLPRSILERFLPSLNERDHRDQRPALTQDPKEFGDGQAIVDVLEDMAADDPIEPVTFEVNLFDIDVEISALPSELAGDVTSRLSRLDILREPLFGREVEDILALKQALLGVAKHQQTVSLVRQTIRTERVEVDSQCQRICVREKSASILTYRTGPLNSSEQETDRPKPAA
jgi:hypothetical protein